MSLVTAEVLQILPTLLDTVQGYKSRESFVTQSATGTPTESVAHTDFGATTFTWARTSAGLYTLSASGATFTANKTAIIFGALGNGLASVKYTVTSSTILTIQTGLLAAGVAVATDALFLNTYMKIIVQN